MSAICGFYNKNGLHVKKDDLDNMIKSYKNCKLDNEKKIYKEKIFMWCGMQYITPESLEEILPYEDKNKGLIITADAIIDNREELFEKLNISNNKRQRITDSELILKSYEMWKYDCPKYLIGDFSFVIYDKNDDKLFCARDHVGKRTLYYYSNKDIFGFSTLEKPLFALIEKINLNERWITDFLAAQGVVQESEMEETIYQEIYQVKPGHCMIIDNTGIKKIKYWNPMQNNKRLKLKSDEEYKNMFLDIYSECVKCKLRSSGDIGILLSGGLDSGSVACLASKELKKTNKRLKAFSSVPIDNYENHESNYYIPNESEYIEEIVKFTGNIDVMYCNSDGKDPLTDIDEHIEMLEQPYKITENLFWIENLNKIAANQNCKVLLDGQYGNLTISSGDILTHLFTLFKEFKLISMIKEINAFSKLLGVSRKQICKKFFKIIIPYKIRDKIDKKLNPSRDRFEYSIVKKELIDKWKVEERFDKEGINVLTPKYYDKYKLNKLVAESLGFSQRGAIETKLSLKYGIIRRDPTIDKRIIEFCISLPSDQFVKNGLERRLVREYMDGLLPDKVRLNMKRRGVQSADRVQRISSRWNEIREMLEEDLNNEKANEYIDINKLKKGLDSIGSSINDEDWQVLRMEIISHIFLRFLKINEVT